MSKYENITINTMIFSDFYNTFEEKYPVNIRMMHLAHAMQPRSTVLFAAAMLMDIPALEIRLIDRQEFEDSSPIDFGFFEVNPDQYLQVVEHNVKQFFSHKDPKVTKEFMQDVWFTIEIAKNLINAKTIEDRMGVYYEDYLYGNYSNGVILKDLYELASSSVSIDNDIDGYFYSDLFPLCKGPRKLVEEMWNNGKDE